jgi:hypothetical protein
MNHSHVNSHFRGLALLYLFQKLKLTEQQYGFPGHSIMHFVNLINKNQGLQTLAR